MNYEFRPVHQWPGEPSKRQKHSQFSAGWKSTIQLLETELRHLKAKQIVIQAYVDESQIRQDGMLRASARPSKPGVILSFASKHGPLSYPCDTYLNWQDNVRAIALSLESLRRVDRYGVTKRAEQYRGWQRIESKTKRTNENDAAVWLIAITGGNCSRVLSEPDYGATLLRRASVKLHPDAGGSEEEFRRLQQVKQILETYWGV